MFCRLQLNLSKIFPKILPLKMPPGNLPKVLWKDLLDDVGGFQKFRGVRLYLPTNMLGKVIEH